MGKREISLYFDAIVSDSIRDYGPMNAENDKREFVNDLFSESFIETVKRAFHLFTTDRDQTGWWSPFISLVL